MGIGRKFSEGEYDKLLKLVNDHTSSTESLDKAFDRLIEVYKDSTFLGRGKEFTTQEALNFMDSRFLLAFAGNPKSSQQTLTTILENVYNPEVKIKMAANLGAPKDIFRKLLKEKVDPKKNINDFSVEKDSALASNPSAPEDVLRDLANNGSPSVVGQVAANSSIPEDLRRKFVKSEVPYYRAMVAANSSLSDSEWRDLVNDKDDTVVASALGSERATPKFVEDFINEAKNGTRKIGMLTARKIARMPISGDSLLKLVDLNDDEIVKFHALKNENCPEQLVEKLKNDPSKNIQKAIEDYYSSREKVHVSGAMQGGRGDNVLDALLELPIDDLEKMLHSLEKEVARQEEEIGRRKIMVAKQIIGLRGISLENNRILGQEEASRNYGSGEIDREEQ